MITKMIYNPTQNIPLKTGEKGATGKVLGIKTGGVKTAHFIQQIKKTEDNLDCLDSAKIAVIK